LYSGKDVEAFILIVVEHGAEHQVLESIMKLDGVTEGSLVYGEFDIHVTLLVENLEKLRKVHDKIRKLRILTSETLIAYERADRKRSVRNHHVRKLGHKRARHH
jgi:DNA-binding Lrp family transcriptional regulator